MAQELESRASDADRLRRASGGSLERPLLPRFLSALSRLGLGYKTGRIGFTEIGIGIGIGFGFGILTDYPVKYNILYIILRKLKRHWRDLPHSFLCLRLKVLSGRFNLVTGLESEKFHGSEWWCTLQIKLSTRLTDPKLGFTRKIMGQNLVIDKVSSNIRVALTMCV